MMASLTSGAQATGKVDALRPSARGRFIKTGGYAVLLLLAVRTVTGDNFSAITIGV